MTISTVSLDDTTHVVLYSIASHRPQNALWNDALETHNMDKVQNLFFTSLIRHFCWLQSLLISSFVQRICLYFSFSWATVLCTVFINTANHMHWLQKKIARLVCFFFLLEKCHREDLTEVAAMMGAAAALFKTGSPSLLSALCCKQQGSGGTVRVRLLASSEHFNTSHSAL